MSQISVGSPSQHSPTSGTKGVGSVATEGQPSHKSGGLASPAASPADSLNSGTPPQQHADKIIGFMKDRIKNGAASDDSVNPFLKALPQRNRQPSEDRVPVNKGISPGTSRTSDAVRNSQHPALIDRLGHLGQAGQSPSSPAALLEQPPRGGDPIAPPDEDDPRPGESGSNGPGTVDPNDPTLVRGGKIRVPVYNFSWK